MREPPDVSDARDAAAATPRVPPHVVRRNERVLIALGLVPAVLTVVLVVAGVVTRAMREPQETTIPGVETLAVPTSEHVAGVVDYPQTPPAGGAHAPVWQNCGAYDEPVLAERAVHALEHGAVWITYDPVLAGADVQVLRSLARPGTFVLVSPLRGLSAPVVASAWGRQLALQGPGDARLTQFVRAFAQGPQTPEPGMPCSGGIGQPLESAAETG